MKKKSDTPIKNELADKLEDEVRRALKQMQEGVNKNELEPYLDGYKILGSLVEDSEEITPEQVAILGAYTIVAKLAENFDLIKEGKEPIRKKEVAEVIITEVLGGEAKELSIKELPQEVKDAIQKFAEGLKDDN